MPQTPSVDQPAKARRVLPQKRGRQKRRRENTKKIPLDGGKAHPGTDAQGLVTSSAQNNKNPKNQNLKKPGERTTKNNLGWRNSRKRKEVFTRKNKKITNNNDLEGEGGKKNYSKKKGKCRGIRKKTAFGIWVEGGKTYGKGPPGLKRVNKGPRESGDQRGGEKVPSIRESGKARRSRKTFHP